jgi:4,5-DOPA dioxygenase extradiol
MGLGSRELVGSPARLPLADIPVIQLSIDETQPSSFHFEVGRRLAILLKEGILLVGSGNVVHNLLAYAWDRHVQ